MVSSNDFISPNDTGVEVNYSPSAMIDEASFTESVDDELNENENENENESEHNANISSRNDADEQGQQTKTVEHNGTTIEEENANTFFYSDRKDANANQETNNSHDEDQQDIDREDQQDNDDDNDHDDDNDNDHDDDHDDARQFNGFFERQAKFVARNPRMCFWTSLIAALATSIFGMIYGQYSLEASSNGWATRGTVISDRQTQSLLVRLNKKRLFAGDEEDWADLTQNIQVSWEEQLSDFAASGGEDDRRLQQRAFDTFSDDTIHSRFSDQLPFQRAGSLSRRLQDIGSISNNTSSNQIIDGCDFSVYTQNSFTGKTRLWPVWKSERKDTSLLSPDSLRDICVAEENTQRILEQEGLCFGCEQEGKCLPPYSMVLLVRLSIPGGFDMTCDALSAAWAPLYPAMEKQVQRCVADTKQLVLNAGEVDEFPPSCPPHFDTSLVDGQMDQTGLVTYSSSIFATNANEETRDKMYELVDSFDRASTSLVIGAYDTQHDTFRFEFEAEAIASDMALGMLSAIFVVVAIMVHTKSPFITLIGLLQILFSFPLSFTVYTLVFRLEYFPFLNYIGIFVVFALGADDVFVAIDKWKNARLEHPDASTQAVAAMALPDAAGAMFLTTLTTSVAFFATAICPVAPVKLFAIFCGMLVALDYVMCVVLVFPCLCMYDISLQETRREGRRKNYFISLQGATACKARDTVSEEDPAKGGEEEEHDEEKVVAASNEHNTNKTNDDCDDAEKTNKVGHQPNFIQRVLTGYYNILHRVRWLMLMICLGALATAAYYSTTMTLPDSLDVRLLDESIQFEQCGIWRQNLLREALGESSVDSFVFWGVLPADTGNHRNPDSFSSMVLDETFDPSSEEAQLFLLDFCDELYDQDFAPLPKADYVCPMQRFNQWLNDSSVTNGTAWFENCNNATQLPIPDPETFHACMTSFAQTVRERQILSRNGKVTIIFYEFGNRIGYRDGYTALGDEFHLIDKWMQPTLQQGPDGANGGFFIGGDYWWYDTHKAMLETAIGSAGIALAASTLVILFSSRSFTLAIFACLSMVYVLASVVSTMVAMGWSLGFLEAICLSILIGLSADFVTHFSHAYASYKHTTATSSSSPVEDEDVDDDDDRQQSEPTVMMISRGERTKFAIVHMGPSILAACFTTVSAAIVMLFCMVVFFEKFAVVLFYSVIQATVAAFVLFCTFSDCCGPSNPTYLIDTIIRCVTYLCRTTSTTTPDDERPTGTTTMNKNDKSKRNANSESGRTMPTSTSFFSTTSLSQTNPTRTRQG